MPLPNFTPDEKYLIAYIKSREATRMNSFMVVYVLSGMAWFLLGVQYDSTPMLFAGFGTFVVGRIYEENYWWRFIPAWKSLIVKFEAACEAESSNDSNTTTLM